MMKRDERDFKRDMINETQEKKDGCNFLERHRGMELRDRIMEGVKKGERFEELIQGVWEFVEKVVWKKDTRG